MLEQLTLLSAGRPASHSVSQAKEKAWTVLLDSSENIFDCYRNANHDGLCGKTCQELYLATGEKTFPLSCKSGMNSGITSPTASWMLNTSECHKDADVCLLSDILQTGDIPPRYLGHTPPSRKAGKENSRGSAAGAGNAVAKCLTSSNQRLDWETETLVLNDQGGSVMEVSKDVTGTLRAQTHGHEPVVFCIAGNTIDRKVQNGGNGAGFQQGTSYTLNTIDRHAVMCAPVAPTIGASGPPYSRPSNERVETEALCWKDMRVRRLTPLECERLQGFPDGYTDIEYKGKPAPDGARYKALGNSMCVNVMRWIAERIQNVENSND